MEDPKPPDLPPCPDLQMVLTLRRDLEVTTDLCGAVEVERKTLSGPTLMGNGELVGSLVKGG